MKPGARRAGFVLVGGGSTRMGRDKALMPYAGTTLAEHVARAVEAAAGSVTLVGRPERCGGMRYPAIADLSPELGPLGGLEAALEHSGAEWNLVVACDMPDLNVAFLNALLEAAERSGRACLVPVSPSGRLEPLCAAWRRDCLPGIRRALRHNIRKMNEIAAALDSALWPVAEGRWFRNLNTPRDLALDALPERR